MLTEMIKLAWLREKRKKQLHFSGVTVRRLRCILVRVIACLLWFSLVFSSYNLTTNKEKRETERDSYS